MASGSFTGSTNNQYITPRILWSSTSNTTANTSNVTVTFQLYKSSSSSSATYGTGSWTLNINGVAYNFSSQITIPANSTYVTVYTKTVNGIAHNSDGTKSIAISATGGISGTTYTTTSISKTVALDSIPRASTFSVPTSVNTGSNLAVTITPANSTFRHKVQLIIDGTTRHTSDYIAAGTTSGSYSIAHSWLSAYTSRQMVVRLYTYTSTGTTPIGQSEKTITVNVPATIKPTISSFSSAVNSGGLSGNYVQGKSTVKLTCTATMNGGATVVSYAFSGPNLNVSSSSNTATSSTITSSGTLTYKVRVTDSRGRYADSTITIYVYPYVAPKIASIQAQRCLSDGTVDSNGTYAKVTVKATYSPVNGANKRTVTLYSSKDNYATGTTVLASTNTNEVYSDVYGSGFALGTSYTIRAVITDSYNTGTTINKSVTLKVAERTLNIAKDGNGLAIGGLSSITSATDTPKFECNWDATFAQQVRINDSTARSFEVNRFDVSDDVNNDGVDEVAYIRGQFYIADDGSVTLRRRYSLDKGVSHTTQGYIQLRNEDFYVYDPLTVANTVTAPRGRFTSSTDADSTTQTNVALRVGNPDAAHMDFDGNEIIAKNGPTALAELYLAGSALGFYSGDKMAMVIGTDATNAYVQSAPAYARTYAGAANMYITSSGTFGRSTASSERYKKDIENVVNEELDPYKILNIPVRQYRYNEENIPVDGQPEDLYIGLVAEEVAKEYPIATEYTEDGQVEMWNIKMLFPALLKIVQDQQKKIEALEEQINNKAVS